MLGGDPADFSPEIQPDGCPRAESAREKVSQAIESDSHKLDWVHRSADGRRIPTSVHLARIPGVGHRVIAAITDLAKQSRTEETMWRALDNERELNELRSRFTSIDFHEFRTLLGISMPAAWKLDSYLDRLDPGK